MKSSNFSLLLLTSALLPLCFLDTWFHADDFSLLAQLGKYSLFSPKFWNQIILGEVFEPNTNYFYRPVTMLILGVLERSHSVIPFRIFALTLHTLSTFSLYVLISRFRSPSVALIGAIFFSLHPATTTALYSIAAFGDLLFVFFGILGGLSLVSYLDSTSRRSSFLATLFSLTLALGSKETAICLPVLYSCLALLNGKLRKEWRLLSLLYFIAALFLLIRGALLGAFFAGNAADTYHHFGIHSVVACLRYLFDLFVPIPLDILFSNPWVLAFWATVLLLSYNAFRPLFRRFFLSLLILFIPLFPAFHHYGGWYMYGSLAVGSILLSLAIPELKVRSFSVVCSLFVVISVATDFRQAQCFSESGRQNYSLLFQLAHDSKDGVTLVGVPKTMCTHAPLFTWSKQVEYGLAYFFKKHEKVTLLAQPVIDRVSDHLFSVSHRNPHSLDIQLNDTIFSYFSLGTEDIAHKVSLIEKNWLGKPTQIAYEDITRPVLIWTPDGLESGESLPNELANASPNAPKQ
ncbi:MAG: hypothetical protein KDD55_03900 [Bdellovibrionales bacterium]|nr:hypothetical protein [Bdellovibrionales bacterium]